MPKAEGEFDITSWDENTSEELENGGKLTRAIVAMQFKGDITGEGGAEWLMCYREDGTAHFVGLQRIKGAIDGREGTLVVESIGDFDGQQATGAWSVIPGSGTDALAGVRGDGQFQAPLGSKASFEFEYSVG